MVFIEAICEKKLVKHCMNGEQDPRDVFLENLKIMKTLSPRVKATVMDMKVGLLEAHYFEIIPSILHFPINLI